MLLSIKARQRFGTCLVSVLPLSCQILALSGLREVARLHVMHYTKRMEYLLYLHLL